MATPASAHHLAARHDQRMVKYKTKDIDLTTRMAAVRLHGCAALVAVDQALESC